MSKIPESILIQDARNRLKEIVAHPELTPAVAELLLFEAYTMAKTKAREVLRDEYTQYIDNQKESEAEQ